MPLCLPRQVSEGPLLTISAELDAVLVSTWPESTPTRVGTSIDLGGGRGIFSRVYRIELNWSHSDKLADQPRFVVVKLVANGANHESAIAIGAYAREALAYSELLPLHPQRTPRCYAAVLNDDGSYNFVLEDLSHGRSVDQVAGLSPQDAATLARSLGRWHSRDVSSAISTAADRLGVRGPTTAGLSAEGMRRGLDTLRSTWADTLSETEIETFERLVARRHDLIDQFESLPASLCHGDARADNVMFEVDDEPVVLLDWQQVARQAAEADLAWMCATSLSPAARRDSEQKLIATFAEASNQPQSQTSDRYRSSLILPGLAVLFLAQRHIGSEQAKRFVQASLRRIAAAVVDHELV